MHWKFWKKKIEEPKEPFVKEPDYAEVGQAALLIHYLNEKTEVKSALQYITGHAYYKYNFDSTKKIIKIVSAEEAVNTWLKQAMEFGVYRLADLCLPRERLLSIKPTFSEFEVEVEN